MLSNFQNVAFGPRFNLFFLRFVKGVLEIWKESTNFRFASCLTFFWVRYVDAIGRNDVGHLRKRFRIHSNLPEAFQQKTTNTVGLEQSKGIQESYLFEVLYLGLCPKQFPKKTRNGRFWMCFRPISHCLRLGRAKCLTSRWRGPLRHTS